MSSEIGLVGALLGGVLLLLSPCSALLLPSFFAYAFDSSVGRLAGRTAVFYLGLATVMVPLGAGVGAFSSLVTRYRSTAAMVGGIVLIVLGVAIIIGKGFAFGPAQRASAAIKISGTLSVYLLGTVYALAGFCAGPLVGAVLSLALIGGAPVYGGLIGAAFALGMTLPLFVLALLWERLGLGRRTWLRGRELNIGPLHTHTTSLVSGLLFIGIGVLFLLTDGTANLGGIVGVDTDQRIQEFARTVSDAVPNTAVAFVLFAAAAVVLGIRIVRRRRAEQTHHDDTPASGNTGAGGAGTSDAARTANSGSAAESGSSADSGDGSVRRPLPAQGDGPRAGR